MFNDWLVKNKDNFIKFGDMFVSALTDEDTVYNLAERDLEKVARIFRLIMLGGINDCADGTNSPIFREIMDFLKEREDTHE